MLEESLLARRRELGHSVAELARLTSVPRTYIHDCEAGRKFPSRQWIERLAALPPASPKLVDAYDEAAYERACGQRWPYSRATIGLAYDLRHEVGADVPPAALAPVDLPKDFTSLSGRTRCLQTALDLISKVAQRKLDRADTGSDLDSILFVNAPSLERSDLAWLPALRTALHNNWTVVHILAPEPDAARRIQRVRELLSMAAGLHGYVPVVLPEASGAAAATGYAPVETIVAPGAGVLQLHSGGGAASFFPWVAPYEGACRNLANEAHAVQATGTRVLTVLHSGDSTAARGGDADEESHPPDPWLERLPPKAVFDNAVTTAVAHGGRRALIKSGLVVATLPPYTILRLTARLKKSAQARPDQHHLLPLIDAVATNRMLRWQQMHANTSDPHQHICTELAIRTYLRPDGEKLDDYPYQHDPLYSGKELTHAERIDHIKHVIDLLRSPARYEVGLANPTNAAQLPVPAGASYWFCTAEALFYVGPRTTENGTRYVILRDPAVVEGFFQVFDSAWESIPAEDRDRGKVARRLEELVAEAEQGTLTEAQIH